MHLSKAANSALLSGKTVVLTGATGGLGSAMCRYILSLGGNLILVGRNREKTQALQSALLQEYPQAQVSSLLCDLQEMDQVKALADRLSQLPVDILMLNAGTYAIPRAISSAGYDTVFQINFLSHYYLVRRLLPQLSQRKARVVATGSIAHRFHPVDFEDPDYAHHDGANDIYGNSKRFLIFALMELLKDTDVSFAVGHPGISFTGITSHYPKNILKVVRVSMKILFMHPRKACLSMIKAIISPVPYLHWIGPRYFDIWGMPRLRALKSCCREEREKILEAAEAMYETL